MGRSVGRYEGEELVVDTTDVEAGYLDTLGFAGLPQSSAMRTEERFTPAGDRLTVVVTHHDSVYYTKPMVMTYNFVRIDTEIMEWGCTLEGANYDERLEASGHRIAPTPVTENGAALLEQRRRAGALVGCCSLW